MKKKFNQITDEEKRGYVDLYLTGEYTLREVAKWEEYPTPRCTNG